MKVNSAGAEVSRVVLIARESSEQLSRSMGWFFNQKKKEKKVGGKRGERSLCIALCGLHWFCSDNGVTGRIQQRCSKGFSQPASLQEPSADFLETEALG